MPDGGLTYDGGATQDPGDRLIIKGLTGATSVKVTSSQVLLAGMPSIDYSHAAVVLDGTNSYGGGTTVSSGTLLIAHAGALPDGTSLTIGAGGTLLFDPRQTASNASAAGLVAAAVGCSAAFRTSAPIAVASAPANGPVAASALSTLSPLLDRQVKNLSYAAALSAASSGKAEMSAAISSVASDAVFASRRAAFDGIASSPDTPPSASASAWLAANESSWNSSDQNKMTVEALDKVLARFGV